MKLSIQSPRVIPGAGGFTPWIVLRDGEPDAGHATYREACEALKAYKVAGVRRTPLTHQSKPGDEPEWTI